MFNRLRNKELKDAGVCRNKPAHQRYAYMDSLMHRQRALKLSRFCKPCGSNSRSPAISIQPGRGKPVSQRSANVLSGSKPFAIRMRVAQ